MSKIVDLTYPLNPDMLVWPENPRPVYEWIERSNTGSANVTYMSMCAHTGTHVDSPLHFVDGGETIDRLPLDGIECNHPHNKNDDKKIIGDYATKYKLFLTGGSDYHGKYNSLNVGIGDFLSPDEIPVK